MKIYTSASLLGVFVLLAVAEPKCQEQKDQQQETKQADYIGKWQWLATDCCFRESKRTTPKSCSCTKSIEFTATGEFVMGQDGAETERGKYSLRNGLNEGDKGGNQRYLYIGDKAPALLLFRGDTMVINRGYMDLETEYYIPVK